MHITNEVAAVIKRDVQRRTLLDWQLLEVEPMTDLDEVESRFVAFCRQADIQAIGFFGEEDGRIYTRDIKVSSYPWDVKYETEFHREADGKSWVFNPMQEYVREIKDGQSLWYRPLMPFLEGGPSAPRTALLHRMINKACLADVAQMS